MQRFCFLRHLRTEYHWNIQHWTCALGQKLSWNVTDRGIIKLIELQYLWWKWSNPKIYMNKTSKSLWKTGLLSLAGQVRNDIPLAKCRVFGVEEGWGYPAHHPNRCSLRRWWGLDLDVPVPRIFHYFMTTTVGEYVCRGLKSGFAIGRKIETDHDRYIKVTYRLYIR